MRILFYTATAMAAMLATETRAVKLDQFITFFDASPVLHQEFAQT